MDISLFDSSSDIALPYDDPLPAEEQITALSAQSVSSEHTRSLADRIGSTKVYLLSDASKTRGGKRRRDEQEELDDEFDDVSMETAQQRENAILLRGTPISHLRTENIFAYATHFDAHPLCLEWVDDATCVLVFETKTEAREGYRFLQKSLAEEPSLEDGTITAKPVPVAIWPAEDRINATLGQSEGLKGILRMRWATADDVKKRGAKQNSEFYRKHGRNAGKTFDEGPPPLKRRRPDIPVSITVSDASEKARLDEELDRFLAEDGDAPPPPSPPSRMRSDYMTEGRSLLDRTSSIRAHPNHLSARLTSARDLPRRTRSSGLGGERSWDEGKGDLGDRLTEPEGRSQGGRNSRDRRGKRQPRPQVTQEDLDAELDAFLNSKD
ncbi:hypothetical protein C8Q80DRAFT_1097937 [Daedaleopsis nitida]|nr:hypothetical protein C8Q80DRAFT_1097937 [Daedaleopsis nitida]